MHEVFLAFPDDIAHMKMSNLLTRTVGSTPEWNILNIFQHGKQCTRKRFTSNGPWSADSLQTVEYMA